MAQSNAWNKTKGKLKSPDAKPHDENSTTEQRFQRLETGFLDIESRLQSSLASFTEQLIGQLQQGGAMSRGDRTPTPASGGADLGDSPGAATPRANLRSVFAQTGTALPASASRPSGSGVASRTSTTAMLSQWLQNNRRVYDVGYEVTPGAFSGLEKVTFDSDVEAARDIFAKFGTAMGTQSSFAKVLAATPERVILELLVEYAALADGRGEQLTEAELGVTTLVMDLLDATNDRTDLAAALGQYEIPRIDSTMPALYKFLRTLNGNGMAAARAFKHALRKRGSGRLGLASDTVMITVFGVSATFFESLRLVCSINAMTGDKILEMIKAIGTAIEPGASVVANYDKVVAELNTIIREKSDYQATHGVDLDSAAYKVDLIELARLPESWNFRVRPRVSDPTAQVLATYTNKFVSDAVATVGSAGPGRFVSPEVAVSAATGLRDAAMLMQCEVLQALHRQGDTIAEFDELVSAGSRATLASTGLAETMALRAGLGFQPDPTSAPVTMQGLPDAVKWQTIKDFANVHRVPASGVVQKSPGTFTLYYGSEQEAAAAVAVLDKKPFWTTHVKVTAGGASARSSRIQPEPLQHPSFPQDEVSFFDRGWEVARDSWGEPGSGSVGSGSGGVAGAGVIGPGPSLAGPDDGGGGEGASAAARKAAVVSHQEWTFGNEKFDDFRDLLNSAVEDNATLTLTANGSEIEAELKQAVLCPGPAVRIGGLGADESM